MIKEVSPTPSPEQINQNPDAIFKRPEARHWPPIFNRLLRTAITYNLVRDVSQFLDPRSRAVFTKLSITGVHEAGHAMGAKRVARLAGVKVFKNGNGVTSFHLGGEGSLYQLVRKINYIGFLGKAAEEALGVTPHGHGFDIAQNDAYADYYSKITGQSGSAVQAEASGMASSEARSNIDSLIVQGIRYGLEAN